MSLIEKSGGYWRSLLIDILELDPEVLDGHHHPCPACGGTDRFRFDDLDGRGTYHCNGCGAGAGIHLVCKTLGISTSDAWALVKAALPSATHCDAKPKKEYRHLIQKILSQATPIAAGDSVDTYLKSRGILLPPPTILIAPTLFPEDTDPHMMVCKISKGRRLAGIHLTLLKGGVRSHRLIYSLQPGSIIGGAIRLHRIGEAGHLVIGEGIETSLSAGERFNRPAWACMNTTLLEQVEMPEGVTNLMIAGDNDQSYAGQKAAFTRANKSVVQEHRETVVEIPSRIGDDWNSVALTP